MHSYPVCVLIMTVVLWLRFGEAINVCECITVVTLCLHLQNLLQESTDTFFLLNIKYDVYVRNRSVNLHAHDKLWQSVHLQTSQHMFALSETESKALFRYKVPLTVLIQKSVKQGLWHT